MQEPQTTPDLMPLDRYRTMPTIYLTGDPPTPAPFLMGRDEVIRFLRLNDSKTRFPAKAIQRYRHLGLRPVRIGRCVWYRLDDVLRFLDGQQDRLAPKESDDADPDALRAVLCLLHDPHWGKRSNGDIANRLGVSWTLVAELRASP